MKKLPGFLVVSVCIAFANLAAACPTVTTSVVSACEVVQPVQGVVAVQSLAVPSVAVVAPVAVVATPLFTPTVVVNEVVHRRLRPAARVHANRVRVQVR
jgi:hypothetical protein